MFLVATGLQTSGLYFQVPKVRSKQYTAFV